jgi:hypothetical protein
MIKHKDLVLIIMLTELNMWVSGKKINRYLYFLFFYRNQSMVKVRKHGWMVQFMKVIISLAKKMVVESFLGMMVRVTMVNSRKTKFRVLVNIYGLMVDVILVNGLIIKCMEKVSLLGQMVKDIKDHILRIKKKDMVHLNGVMVVNIWVNGRTENNMEKEQL